MNNNLIWDNQETLTQEHDALVLYLLNEENARKECPSNIADALNGQDVYVIMHEV